MKPGVESRQGKGGVNGEAEGGERGRTWGCVQCVVSLLRSGAGEISTLRKCTQKVCMRPKRRWRL